MKPGNKNSFKALKTININDRTYKYYSINEAEKKLEILDDKLSQQRPFHQKRYRPYISFLWGELYFQKNKLICENKCLSQKKGI